MTPPASQAAARTRRAVRETEARRPPLRVVGRAERRRARARRRPIAVPLAIAVVVCSLVAVVVAHTMVASTQVDLTGAQAQLATEQSVHQQRELAVARLESPQRIATEASSMHMAQQTIVNQLPYVPLTVALATPTVTPAPAAPPPTTTASSPGTGSATTTTASSGSTSTSATTGASAGSTTATTTPSSTSGSTPGT